MEFIRGGHGRQIAIMEYFAPRSMEIGRFVTIDVRTGQKNDLAPFARFGEVHGSL